MYPVAGGTCKTVDGRAKRIMGRCAGWGLA